MRSLTKTTAFAISLAVALATGCGVPKKTYNGDISRLGKQIHSLEATNADLFKRNGLLQQQLSDCTREKTGCQRELSAIRSQGAALDANLARALERIRALEAIAAKQQAIFDHLTAALDQLVKAGKLTVSIVRGQFTVQMSDKILFDSGRYTIKKDAEQTLREVTTVLRTVSGRLWQVAGHTDSDGGDDYNWRLSANRALAVTAFMIEQGMPPESISFAGYGEYAPTASNDTPETKALNRRIEIVLIPDLEALLGPLGTTPSPPKAGTSP